MPWLVLLLLADPTAAAPTSTAAATTAARVTLQGQRGELDLSGSAPRLQFSVVAQSTLPVPVEMVEVGVLFAATEAALHGVDAGELYQAEPAVGRKVGVVRRRVDVVVPARAEAPLNIDLPLAEGDPEPLAFLTHVLGYRLAEVSVPLFFELLNSEAAADEVAVTETMALTGTAEQKLAVRRRWAEKPGLIEALIAEARLDPGRNATHGQTLRRVFVVRALGVLGGDGAMRTLQELLKDARLASFDEALQVLRVARLVGSRLETPLAFAVPPEARRMQDVVAAALDDVEAPRDSPLARVAPDAQLDNAAPPASDERAANDASAARGSVNWPAVTAVALLVLSLVLSILRRARRHRALVQSKAQAPQTQSIGDHRD